MVPDATALRPEAVLGSVQRRMSRFVLKFGGDPELAQAT
jgi:hypothetical protein